jgi:hypothetical protein
MQVEAILAMCQRVLSQLLPVGYKGRHRIVFPMECKFRRRQWLTVPRIFHPPSEVHSVQ